MSERTEQPTPRRRQDARQKGQIARSPEIAATVSLLSALLALRVFGPWLYGGIREIGERALSHPYQRELMPELVTQNVTAAALTAGRALLPIAALSCVGAIVANLLQSGFIYTAKPLVPDFSRVNPVEGAKRILSMRGLGELVKSLLKLGLLSAVAYHYVRSRIPVLSTLSSLQGTAAAGVVGGMVWDLLLRLGLVMAVIAVADYLFQRRVFEKSIRMSKAEVKEEHRRSEGDPQIKARMRRLQQQLARGRMMHRVKDATVVVTNPIHLAVALRYEPDENPAPVVLAKGQRKAAERIREEARRHSVPLVENVPLAHTLFNSVAVGQPIPADLYQAVAEIIAFVYRLTGRARAAGER